MAIWAFEKQRGLGRGREEESTGEAIMRSNEQDDFAGSAW